MGLDEEVARAEWSELRAIFPDADGGEPPRSLRALAQAALYALSIDAGHPHSIFFSLKKARDNARTVREALTIEVFVSLNETYQELEAYNRRQMADPPTFRSALAATQRGILSTAGAIEQTLARDPGWLFLKLGESMERVFRTAVVLRVKLPTLMAQEPKVDLPALLHALARRSCAASRRSRTTARCTARASSPRMRSSSCSSTRTRRGPCATGPPPSRRSSSASRGPTISRSPRASWASSPPTSPTRDRTCSATARRSPSSTRSSASWRAATTRSRRTYFGT